LRVAHDCVETGLVAVGDGYRESTESWPEPLRGLKRRGMRSPVLAIGDGALGFWGALRDVFPESHEQRVGSITPTSGLSGSDGSPKIRR